MSVQGSRPGVYSKAYTALCDYIRRHPTFANGRLIKSWKFRTSGKPDEVADPTTSEMPWCRLSPLAIPATKTAFHGKQVVHLAPLRIGIELAVAGTDARDIIDLSFHLYDVLFPTDAGERATIDTVMAGVGVREILWGQFPMPESLEDYGTAAMVGKGSFDLKIFLNA